MRKILTLIISIAAAQVFSQDIRGAYISTKWVSGLTYSISITLFTEASKNITRPTVPISFGDGSPSGTFALGTTSSANGINLKTYSGTHTYPGPGTYLAFYLDTFRIAGIKNILNSQTQQIYLATKISINNTLGLAN